MPAIELEALAGISFERDKIREAKEKREDERTNVAGGAKRN
jgi:hypothetical protein